MIVRTKRKIVDLEKVNDINIEESVMFIIGMIFHLPLICFRKYIEMKNDKRKNPAKIFGWGNVPYALRIAFPERDTKLDPRRPATTSDSPKNFKPKDAPLLNCKYPIIPCTNIEKSRVVEQKIICFLVNFVALRYSTKSKKEKRYERKRMEFKATKISLNKMFWNKRNIVKRRKEILYLWNIILK